MMGDIFMKFGIISENVLVVESLDTTVVYTNLSKHNPGESKQPFSSHIRRIAGKINHTRSDQKINYLHQKFASRDYVCFRQSVHISIYIQDCKEFFGVFCHIYLKVSQLNKTHNDN